MDREELTLTLESVLSTGCSIFIVRRRVAPRSRVMGVMVEDRKYVSSAAGLRLILYGCTCLDC